MPTTIVIGIIVLVLLALVVVAVSVRRNDTLTAIGQLSNETIRRDRSDSSAGAPDGPSGKEVEASARLGAAVEASPAVPPATYIPPDPETIGVNRRQFLNRGIVAVFGLGLTSFGAACLAFLWPPPGGGFGSRLNVGRVDDVKAAIKAGSGFLYVPQGRMWVTEYPEAALAKAAGTYGFYPQVEQGLNQGVVALFQTCPHLGCRVPQCVTSQWFECPCHGSQYNRVGEKKGGPAPRGMDRFPMQVNAANELIVDTGVIISGPPVGVNTTGQEAEGPNCLSDAGGH